MGLLCFASMEQILYTPARPSTTYLVSVFAVEMYSHSAMYALEAI